MSDPNPQREQELAALRASLATPGLPPETIRLLSEQIAQKEAAHAAPQGGAPATPGGVIDFQGSQPGEVTIREVAAGNIYKHTIQAPRPWPTAVIILTLALLAAGAAATICWQATASLGWAVTSALACAAFVLALGFITRVGEHLDKAWTKLVADWLDRQLRLRVGGLGYERRYRTFLIQEHRFFDVKGLSTQGPYSLMLQEVFVDLGLAPQEAQKASADPLRLPEQLRTGRHSIWDYLASPQLAQQGLVILGPPGSGKTTLLRHIALTLAQGGSVAGRRLKGLPLMLTLRSHARAIGANEHITLIQVIHAHLAREEGPRLPGDWLSRQLQAGGCSVLLDGLDEVGDAALRQKVVAWVQRQMQAYPRCRFLISSRPFGYRENPLGGVTVLEVHPFTSAQVRCFVEQWYLANMLMSTGKDDPGVRRDARHGASDLLQRISSAPALSDLAVNPLLLTMIANVHRHRSSLPGRRVELYAEICDVFLGKRQQAKGLVLDLTPTQKQSVLQPLAYHLMLHGQREISGAQAAAVIREALLSVDPSATPAAFLGAIRDSSGLVLERENGIYSFTHMTFQEYLAAAHIKEQQLEADLAARVGASWWHETVLLYAAQGDATSLVRACIGAEPPTIAGLMLAIELRDEARQIEPTLRVQLDELLTRGVEDPDPERRQMIAEAMLARRLRRMWRLDERRAVDTSLVSNAEYQLFIDQRAQARSYHYPDHWTTPRHPAGAGQAPALGIRWSDAVAFCTWLSERDTGEWVYRLPTSEEAQGWAGRDVHAGLVCWANSQPGACWPEPPDADMEALETQALHDRARSEVERLLVTLTSIDAPTFFHNLATDLDTSARRARELLQGSTLERTAPSVQQFSSSILNFIKGSLEYIERINVNIKTAIDLARSIKTIAIINPSVLHKSWFVHADNIAHALFQSFNWVEKLKEHLSLIINHIEGLAIPDNTTKTIGYTIVNAQVFNLTKALNTARDLAENHDHMRDVIDIINTTRAKYGLSTGGSLTMEQMLAFSDIIPIPQPKQHQIPALSTPALLDVEQSFDLVVAKMDSLNLDELKTPEQAIKELLSKAELPFAAASLLRRQHFQEPEAEHHYAQNRLFARLYCLTLALQLEGAFMHTKAPPQGRFSPSEPWFRLKVLRGRFWELYISYAILEQRIAGIFQPIEGILLVRERREQAPGPPQQG